MFKGYTIGNIYILNPQVDLRELPVKEANRYKRMAALKVIYFVAVRKTTDNHTIFAPLYTEKMKKGIELLINGETYYASCSAMPRAVNGWLIDSGIVDRVSKELLETIKEKNRQWQEKINQNHRQKRQEDEKELAQLAADIEDSKSSNTPKMKPPSSVSWQMTHPVQGGSVTPQ